MHKKKKKEEGAARTRTRTTSTRQDDIDKKKIKTIVVGTTTLLVEPKFINKGMRVGYIEDVSVRKGYDGLGIGSQLIAYAIHDAISVEACGKILLYCLKIPCRFMKN